MPAIQQPSGTMNLLSVAPWLDILQTAVIFMLWLRKPGEDAKQDLEKLRADLKVFEERIKHMPTINELTALEGKVNAIARGVEHLEGSIKSTNSGVQRIEDFLRANK